MSAYHEVPYIIFVPHALNANAPLKPILASGFLTICQVIIKSLHIVYDKVYFQIDLIDMRHMPDNSYHYIAHYMDHWYILWPMMKKSAVEVAMGLVTLVFPYLGLPKILQSDNGREFVNEVIKETLNMWPGDVVVINGHPQHSQSQRLVEKGNHLVELQLQAEWKGRGNIPWSDWIP